MKSRYLFLILALALPLSAAEKTVLRVGYFPNITHAQGLVGSQSTREGKGWFDERLGSDVTVQWFPYNAGPSAMEALLAGSIDLTYVGPNPALNVYIRSQGSEVRILAGAAEGGVALVVQGDGRIAKPADFKGRKLATPQLGNTQDVAARSWLSQQGFRVTLTGGDVTVLPTANSDQLPLFLQGKLDAVWTVEPWLTRLERDGKGKVMLDDLVQSLKGATYEVILAIGHTDRIGSVAYNQKLSVRRSEAVKAYLVTKGIEKNRIYTEGKGEKQPIADNKTKEGRAKNRRVEIEVVGTRAN